VKRVLVAPNAFKGSLTSVEAAAAMCAAVAMVYPEADIVARPLADGGDGSVDALIAAGYARVDVPVRFPDGAVSTAPIAQREHEFVVELANTCGLVLTSPSDRRPMSSNTVALADAVKGALDSGAERIVICVGGSASTDGGVGLISGLGARVLNASGEVVRPGGAWLAEIASVDLTGLDPRLSGVELTVATDVSSPLIGPDGAARTFGPQKGATADEVVMLDEGLRSWADVVAAQFGRDPRNEPGSGAAGGTAFAALALLGATLIPGAEFVANAIGLETAIGDTDLLITGEGSLDEQSLLGKGAVHAAQVARAHGVPTVMVCGRLDVAPSALGDLGAVAAGALVDIAAPEDAMANAAALLARRTIEVLATRRRATD
jgi:glycerate kinase